MGSYCCKQIHYILAVHKSQNPTFTRREEIQDGTKAHFNVFA